MGKTSGAIILLTLSKAGVRGASCALRTNLGQFFRPSDSRIEHPIGLVAGALMLTSREVVWTRLFLGLPTVHA